MLTYKTYKNIVLDFHGPICSTYAKQNQIIVDFISQKNRDITFKSTWCKAFNLLREKKGYLYIQELCEEYNVPLENIREKVSFDSSVYKSINTRTSNFIIENKANVFLYTFSSENIVTQLRASNPFLAEYNIPIFSGEGISTRRDLLLNILNFNNINNESTIIIDDKDLLSQAGINASIFVYDYPVSINKYIYKRICKHKPYL